jgi:hypothetical protein
MPLFSLSVPLTQQRPSGNKQTNMAQPALSVIFLVMMNLLHGLKSQTIKHSVQSSQHLKIEKTN